MTEAEVVLRLADYLSSPRRTSGRIEVAIDGAMVRVS